MLLTTVEQVRFPVKIIGNIALKIIINDMKLPEEFKIFVLTLLIDDTI